MFDMPVYLINLDGSDARLDAASAALDRHGIAFTRVPAFDGRGMDPASVPEYDAAGARRWFGRDLSGGEVGCFMSHRDCARRFLETSVPVGLVLEDDVAIGDDSRPVLEALAQWLADRAADWDVVNVARPCRRISSRLDRFEGRTGPFVLYHAHLFPLKTTGLVWTKAGASAFLAESQSFHMPVDHFLRHWQSRRDRGLALDPAPLSPSGAASEIDFARRGGRRKGQSRSLHYLVRKQLRGLGGKARALRNRMVRGRRR